MELKINFLRTIHSLPEGTRKFLAAALMALAAGALFVSWGKIMSSRLTAISTDRSSASGFIAPPAEEFSGTLSPTAGIIDTLKSIEKLWSR